MARRLRLGDVYGIEMAIDSIRVLSLILAAWTLVTAAGHALPPASSAAAMVVGVAAATGVFASLAVHELGLPIAAGSSVPARAPAIALLPSSVGAVNLAGVITKEPGVTTARSHRGALET
jgi:hypothetical protein